MLIMGIAGGAIIPHLFALLKEHYNFQVVFLADTVPCYLYILYFALRGHRAGLGASRIEKRFRPPAGRNLSRHQARWNGTRITLRL